MVDREACGMCGSGGDGVGGAPHREMGRVRLLCGLPQVVRYGYDQGEVTSNQHRKPDSLAQIRLHFLSLLNYSINVVKFLSSLSPCT